MTGILVSPPVLRALDANGFPMPGAKLQFYQTGTTTPQNVFTSSTLGVALPNPVVADAGGLFPAIYMDPTLVYRCILKTSAGVVVEDIDPLNLVFTPANGSITGVMLAGGAVVTNLGFTPLNRAGDTATNLLIANSALSPTSAGYLGTPVNEQDGNYTLVLGDAGKMIRCNSAGAVTYTIPPSGSVAYPIGTCMVIRNIGAGTLTIARGAGVILWKAGSGTSADVAMAQFGIATLILESSNWVISGSGIS